jgi:hypothetical protein
MDKEHFMAQQQRNNPSQPQQDQENQRGQASQGSRSGSQQQDQGGSSGATPSSRRNQVGRETPKDDRDRYSGGRSGNE